MDEASYRRDLKDQGYADPVEVEWAPGTVNDTHTHDFAANLLILSGEITVTTEHGSTTCRAGDTFKLDSGVPHTELVGDEGVRFLAGRRA